ncbi:MAG: M24 family metallopeptidase, partial [Paracoccaceae bacterium]
ARAARAQTAMAEAGLDALWFTTETEVRYFSGFRTLFWQSPTRPWHLILPRDGAPIAVIPAIGAELMATTWVKDIRTWASPDPVDDGMTLLTNALTPFATIGTPMGVEASLRLPLSAYHAVTDALPGRLADCSALVHDLRAIKSAAEIATHRQICSAASDAFDRAGELFHEGQPLNEAFRAFKIALLQAGAEEVPYLVGGAGQGGYGDVISPPGATPLAAGDVLMLDTGSTLQGYFCDFDRNFAIGHADDAARRAYETLWQATEAGLSTARPGATCADIFNAMQAVIGGGSDIGRVGHGLGMQLTEQPSLTSWEDTPMRTGMVMTLEPSMEISPGKMMVHEENIVIHEDGAEWLSHRAPLEMPVIE